MTIDLTAIRSAVSSPREFFDKLVQASLDGKLPARGKAPGAGEGASELCRYCTANGRQCGIGLLFSPEDAAALEVLEAGPVGVNRDLFAKILPGWLSLEEARLVQRAHDDLALKLVWSHDKWVSDLRSIPLFSSF